MTNPVTPTHTSYTTPSLCRCLGSLCQKVHAFFHGWISWIANLFCPQPQLQPSPIFSAARVSNRTQTASLVGFYRDNLANDHGLTLHQMIQRNLGVLESDHSYIQWLFPLQLRSQFNPTAPVFDGATLRAFQTDPVIQSNMRLALNRMLEFYGLELVQPLRIQRQAAPLFQQRAAVWLTPGNHNFLRLTRILKSLNLAGLPEYSQALFTILSSIFHNEGRGIISPRTFQIWASAGHM